MMEVPMKTDMDNNDVSNIISGVEGESSDGEVKRYKLDEALDIDIGSENIQGVVTVTKAGQFTQMQNAIHEVHPFVAEVEGRGRHGGGGPVKFEFHFPEEVWLLILDMVEDVDRVNCCRAIPYLDRILTASKPVFLCDQVLPLMDEWLNETERLNCRRVCKKWCVAEDQVMYSKRAQPFELHSDGNSNYEFNNVEEVDRFIQAFSGHTRSPFIDGTVCIVNKDQEDMDDEYPERVLRLLRQFGRHVMILEIGGFCEALSLLDWYVLLQDALKKTPNLRQLVIYEEGMVVDDENDEDVFELYSHMMQNPLPFIPSVESLYLFLHDPTSETVQNIHNMLMLPYATQLKRLSVNMGNWKDHYATGLVKLSEFHLSYMESDADLERVLHLTAATAPLENLELCVSCSLSVPVLLGVLKKFPMLKNVSISFNKMDDGLRNGEDISHFSHLQVPGVTSLDIGYNNGTASYNFLQMFTSLRRLYIIVRSEAVMEIEKLTSEEGEDKLQLFKTLEGRNIYDSNIWKLIPTLQYVKIEHFRLHSGTVLSGTREGYDVYSSNPN